MSRKAFTCLKAAEWQYDTSTTASRRTQDELPALMLRGAMDSEEYR